MKYIKYDLKKIIYYLLSIYVNINIYFEIDQNGLIYVLTYIKVINKMLFDSSDWYYCLCLIQQCTLPNNF